MGRIGEVDRCLGIRHILAELKFLILLPNQTPTHERSRMWLGCLILVRGDLQPPSYCIHSFAFTKMCDQTDQRAQFEYRAFSMNKYQENTSLPHLAIRLHLVSGRTVKSVCGPELPPAYLRIPSVLLLHVARNLPLPSTKREEQHGANIPFR